MTKCLSSLQRLPPCCCWVLIVTSLCHQTSFMLCKLVLWLAPIFKECGSLPYCSFCKELSFPPPTYFFLFLSLLLMITFGLSCAPQLFNFISQFFRIHYQFTTFVCVLYRATNKSSWWIRFILFFRWWSSVEKASAVWSRCFQCPLDAHFRTKEEPESSEAKITPQKSIMLF